MSNNYKKLLESFAKEINENAQQKHLLDIKAKLDELTFEREGNSKKIISDKSRELQSITDRNKHLAGEVTNLKKKLKDQEKQQVLTAEKIQEKKNMEDKIRQLENQMEQITVEKDRKENETKEMKEILEKQRKENEELVNMLMQLKGIVSSKRLDNNMEPSNNENKDSNTKELKNKDNKKNKDVNKNKGDNKEVNNVDNKDKADGKEGTSKGENKNKTDNKESTSKGENKNKADNKVDGNKKAPKKNNAAAKGSENETMEQIILKLANGLEDMKSASNKGKASKKNPQAPTPANNANKPKKSNQPNVVTQMNDLSGGKVNNAKTPNQPSSSKSNSGPSNAESKISNIGDKSKDKSGSYNLWDELETMKKNIKDGKISRNELCTKVSTLISDASKATIPSKENFMSEVAECLQDVNKLPDSKEDFNKKNNKPGKHQNPTMKKNSSSENLGKGKTRRQNKGKGQGNNVQGGTASDAVDQEGNNQDNAENVEEANIPVGGKSKSAPVAPPRPSKNNLNIVQQESSQPDDQDDSSDDDETYAKGNILNKFLGNRIPTLLQALTDKIDVTLKVKNLKMVAVQDGQTVCFEPTNLLDIIQFKQQNPKSVCVEDHLTE